MERKARRGEIDPMHEHVIQNISQLSGLKRHEMMDLMFDDPQMLEDLDFLFKDETARKLLVYYQPGDGTEMSLLTTDGTNSPITGLGIYFLRLSTRIVLSIISISTLNHHRLFPNHIFFIIVGMFWV